MPGLQFERNGQTPFEVQDLPQTICAYNAQRFDLSLPWLINLIDTSMHAFCTSSRLRCQAANHML